MTRMIERWFPCAEVSAASKAGWGSGNTERSLFTWFAHRPTAQAKAAVLCSLLPWPDDLDNQQRLQELVRAAMTGRYAVWKDVRAAISASHPEGTSVLDPFSGRGMIPLEAARIGISSMGFDYAPVATLASRLLAEYPFQDWSDEPSIPFAETSSGESLYEHRPRLLVDVERVLREIGARLASTLSDLYPSVEGKAPWGYLWAVTLPCQECGNRFPLVGSYELRKPGQRKDPKTGRRFYDPGQSYFIEGNIKSGRCSVIVHDGPTKRTPILSNALGADGKKIRGKAARCPHCAHSHPVRIHQRMADKGLGLDSLLLVADIDAMVGKKFRLPTPAETAAVSAARSKLLTEARFSPVLPAVPDEEIPPEIGALVRPQLYGARKYGDLMCDRQTLATIRLARCIESVGKELRDADVSDTYVRALSGYAAAVLIRKLRRSTRGCTLDSARAGVHDIYANQGTISYSYDFFEAGIADGPGTWTSLAESTLSTLKSLLEGLQGIPAIIDLSSAVTLPLQDDSVGVVVTDPPYDALIYYSDSSDFFYTWIKRALGHIFPELTIPRDPRGLQDKSEEIIVWGHRSGPQEHRDRGHYDSLIARAFGEMRRVIKPEGLVTIVFGHGEIEVWQRLLTAISKADLVMTASWPANTESGGANGGMSNIETTLTMACRPAPTSRPTGRKGAIESEIKAEIKRRYEDWERWGLAPADMLMAAAGPAMEVVGRYSCVLDARGEPVDTHTFLPLARVAVQEAMAVEVDHHPLEAFDARTRFALWWVRLYGRQVQAKSELRWQALASSMDSAEVRDLIPDRDKGVAFVQSGKFRSRPTVDSAVIDVAMALAAASEEGISSMGEVLAASGRGADDTYLWAAVKFLADRLSDSDPDAIAFTRVLRTRDGISNAASAIANHEDAEHKKQQLANAQLRML